MTEEEKELQEKIKQYKYEQEENEKKIERLHKDTHKGNKKSFTYRLSKAFGNFVIVLASMGFIIWFFLLIYFLSNLIVQLRSFDAVIAVEKRYDIDLKKLSREVEDKIITYKVKPKNWKYQNVEFTVIRVERSQNLDDFPAQYAKYLIEKIENKDIINQFTINETYDKYGLMTYELIYNGDEEDRDNIIKIIQNYIQEIDKNNIINTTEVVK